MHAAELLGGGLLLLRPDGAVLAANQVACELLGDAGLQRPGATITQLAATHAGLVSWLAQAMTGTGAAPYTLTVPAADGDRRWSGVLHPLPSHSGSTDAPLWLWRAFDVTAHGSAARLRASASLPRGAFGTGLDSLVIARAERDPSGAIREFRVMDVNARSGAVAGRPPALLIGGPVDALFPHSAEWALWDDCCTVTISRRPLDRTHEVSTEDGLRWIWLQLVPVDRDTVAISTQDVTEHHVEQETLEQSEARHRQLFESNGAIQLLADLDTAAIVDANPAAEAFYGWPRVTMRTMRLTDLESVSLDHWRELTRSIATGTGLHVVRDHHLAGGERRQVNAYMGVVEVAQRRLLHIIIQDISDRVRAEEQLRESEERLRIVLSGMREGLVLYDAQGQVRLSNTSAQRILGLTADQLAGTAPLPPAWQVMREDGSPCPLLELPPFVALRTGASQPRRIVVLQRPDADQVWLQVTADPLFRPGGTRPFAAVAVFSDVTSQRSSEERARQVQKLEAVAQLAGALAHDYNNLLTVIRGATGFLRDGIASTSPHLEDVAAIERATERAEELTRRLLAVGRRQRLRTESVELNQLLRDQLPVMRDELPLAIFTALELAPTAVLADVDREQLLDALHSLVDNARAAMPDGGTLRLGTSQALVPHPHAGDRDPRAQHFAVLTVRDSGYGMSEEIRARLFEPFFSTQQFGTSKGMGLAMVHGLVHQSQGFMECDSVSGQGTTVRLFFPLAGAPESDASTFGADPQDSRRGGVLLVDDDALLRELGRRMLEKLGHAVYPVASGQEALRFLAQRARDVAVMVTDLTMPGMSGFELIDAVRTQHAGLPMVIMSGYANDPAARERLDAQQVPFVSKPFTADQLADGIRRALVRN